jgi:two-component system nitrogen regulation response regulator GlnG
VAINCAALPESLLESELFGHERGSFTGADRRRIGKFEQAGGGTIFLDEIGDMSSATQAKVLRVLQDQRFERVGGSETVQTDVRVVAATNQALEDLVSAGRFRSDLFYRLNVYTIKLPPLRERIEDVPLLVDYFIRQFNEEVGRSVRSASPETIEILQRYLWPGNVRELQATVKNALVNATTHVLTPDCLPVFVRQGADLAKNLASAQPQDFKLTNLIRTLLQQGEDDIYRKVAFAVDHVLLDEVMRSVNGNQLEASRRLGISRTTLRAKLQVHRLSELASEADDSAHDSPGGQS